MYNAELQMLREFFWFHAPAKICVFCNKPILQRPQQMTFGHRRHPKVRIKWTLHHEEFDRSKNTQQDLKDSHSECHRRFHKQLLEHGGNHV